MEAPAINTEDQPSSLEQSSGRHLPRTAGSGIPFWYFEFERNAGAAVAIQVHWGQSYWRHPFLSMAAREWRHFLESRLSPSPRWSLSVNQPV